MHWKKMTLLQYINSENRNFFLPDTATNGLAHVGYKAYEVYEDPEKQLELALKMNDLFESDFIYSFCDGAIFCETLGLELYKPDYDFPNVSSHPVKTLADVQKLRVPDPYKTLVMSHGQMVSSYSQQEITSSEILQDSAEGMLSAEKSAL